MLPVRPVASLRRRNASGRRLDDDCPGHVRMQGTKVFKNAWCRERERELVVAVERLGPEIIERDHGMGNVVFIGPGNRGARSHLQFLWPEGKIANLNCDLVC